MKLFKRILSVSISIVLIISTFCFVNITANAYTSGYYTYTVSNGKATITSCDNSISGSITIPSKLGGYTVTIIGENAFHMCTKLTEVTIPGSIKTIDNGAFHDCPNLKSVKISNGVEYIKGDAFSFCSLTRITIPKSVKTLNATAFSFCPLKKISVDNGNKNFCDVNGILFNKSKTKIVLYPSEKASASYNIPKSVKTIGDYAFKSCIDLKKVTIPNSVKTIGSCAFFDCFSLKTVKFGNKITKISSHAFCNCLSLENFKLPTSLKTIGESAFDDCVKITSLTIPSGVTSVGREAFMSCTGLKTVTIAKSVKKIGYQAIGYYFNHNYSRLKISGFKIKGKKGSTAEKYAKNNGFKFVKI